MKFKFCKKFGLKWAVTILQSILVAQKILFNKYKNCNLSAVLNFCSLSIYFLKKVYFVTFLSFCFVFKTSNAQIFIKIVNFCLILLVAAVEDFTAGSIFLFLKFFLCKRFFEVDLLLKNKKIILTLKHFPMGTCELSIFLDGVFRCILIFGQWKFSKST